MISRPALRLMLASMATLLVSIVAIAQTPLLPRSNGAVSNNSAQIIPASFSNEQIAATINGDKILVGDVKKILDQRPYPITPTEEQKKQIRHAALDVLIEDIVMRQYLSKQVPQVGQAEFNKEIQELEDALMKQKKDIKTFLHESNQTEEQLHQDIVARLRWKYLLARQYPDQKLKDYYDNNKPFFDKVFVQASHILIKLPASATKEQRHQALQQMLVWRQDIMSGKIKFEDVAKQYSQCPSKDKGGDIGKFPYKFVVVPEFAKTAFSLKEGEISDVVQTVFGIHLIKVTERSKGESSTFIGLQETVREVWAQDDDLYQRILTEQRKASDIKVLLP